MVCQSVSLLLLTVLSLNLVTAGKVQVTPMNLALNLRVKPTQQEWSQTEKEVKALLAHAKANKYSTNVLLMLQGIATKVEQTGAQMLVAIQEKEATAAKNRVLSESTFTAPDVAVKPLKKFLAAKKDVNVPRYTVEQLKQKIAAKKVDFARPFLVSNGVTDLEKMQSKFTAKNLMNSAYSHVKVRYITPVEAKKHRKFDQKDSVGQEEQLQAHMITFEKFFVNCFNLRARKDFKKLPGANTEHCENTMDAAVLDKDYSFKAFSNMSWMQDFQDAKAEWVTSVAADVTPLIPKVVTMDQLAGTNGRLFTFGPSGSGNELRAERDSMIDGLLHGRRRWLFMNADHFHTLIEKAQHDMEPASAFVFFESQLSELQEDYNLGRKKLPYMECNQELGDLLYIPKGMFRTSLSLQDSSSFVQKLVTSQQELVDSINRDTWDTFSGNIPSSFRAMACFNYDMTKLQQSGLSSHTGVFGNAQQGAMITQLMKQNFGVPHTTNMLALGVLSSCNGLSSKFPNLLADTPCSKLWQPCTNTIKENAKKMSVKIPDFLSKDGKLEL